jgi:hypothetical protein
VEGFLDALMGDVASRAAGVARPSDWVAMAIERQELL